MPYKDPEKGWLPIPEEQKPGEMMADVKVLDISHHLSGPYLTKILADYGADVIKIEDPNGGDIARRMGPFPDDLPHYEKSGTFLYLNTNKRGITLNLATATGRKIFRELLKDVDILVENFEPRKMREWGLTHDALKEVNPRLVMTSITNFGQWGPYRDYKATEIVIFAMGGPMCNTGVEEREPLKLYDSVSAYQVALNTLIATMAALRWARQTGVGQQIDVSMFEAMLSSIDRRGNYLTTYAYNGRDRTETFRTAESATGLLSALGAPCADGYVQFTGASARNFGRFMRWSGHTELIGDPRFATEDLIMQEDQRGITDAYLRSFFLDHTMIELMETMEQYQIPGGCVYTVDSIVADPHTQFRQFFVDVDHPVAGTVRMPGAPARPMETPWCLRRPAPTLGQHNEEVYCGMLGYTRQDLVLLRERNII